MVKKLLISLISLSGVLLLCACQVIKQSVEKNSKLSTSIQPEAVKVDTTKKNQVLLRPYRDVITAKAITDSGLFIVHKVLERYYFEIPNSLIGRDILTVNRVSKAATEGEQGFFGYGGDQIGENIIQFCKGPNNKLFIRRMFYRVVAKDSSDDGLYRALNNSNLQPIIASFDVKALSPDSSGVVIDATDYINGDNNDVFYFDVQFKKNIQFLGGYQADKSYIAGVKSFPNNVEIQSIKTFIKEGSSSLAFTYELNSSIILLPAVPMKTRLEDERIGYFTRGFVNLDDPKGVDLYGSYMIIRWRLEPKDEDVEKYLKGELVEPKKPIVFFIDPATPKKWVPYLKLGVNDWQKAFEKAGFKNAIYALDAPVADSAWSLSDATHNVIIYKASAVFNAYGPQVSDPRSGEILETHIQWFHNLIQLLQNWYMVQAGAIDARARKMQFDDHLMGQLMRFACAHEVGHTLGLRHNFGASFSVPVDSLRNKQWVEKNGVCPSIMDYARFNYVAQPEDSISENGILPKIGVYDEWAIEWAYRWFPEFKTKEEERAYLNKWVIERTSKDKRLWFGNESQTTDLRCQAEDLGDNAMKAGYYGIQNLKRIFPQLIEWTKLPGTSYNNLARMQAQIMLQYRRYLLHVSNNIGSWMNTTKTVEQNGPQFEFATRERQKEALKFLQEELFGSADWTANKDVFSLVGGNGYYPLIQLQDEVLKKILSINTLGVLLYFEANYPNKAYTAREFLNDLQGGMLLELKKGNSIGFYRRNLQKIYVNRLFNLLTEIENKSTFNWGNTDLPTLINNQLHCLEVDIKKAIPYYKDGIVKQHLRDILSRIQYRLKLKKNQTETQKNGTAFDESEVFGNLIALPNHSSKDRCNVNCWEESY